MESSASLARTRRNPESRARKRAKGSQRAGLPPLLASCGSASSTTACSRTRSAAPSAGTATSPQRLAADGPRGDVPDAAPVGARVDAARYRGVRVVAAGPRMALYGGDGSAGSCRRSSSAPASSRHLLRHGRSLRRRPHVARSRTSRCSRPRCVRPLGPLSRSSSTGSRCGAAPTGASTSAGRRPRRAGRAAALPARPPARLLLLAAAPRAGCASDGLRGDVTVLAGCTPARLGRRRRRPPSRSSSSPAATSREKRAPAVLVAVAARARVPGLRGRDLRRRARARRACWPRSPSSARRARRGARLRRRPSGVERRAARARSASCCRRGARATGSWSSRRRRAARRASWWPRSRQRRRPSWSRRA